MSPESLSSTQDEILARGLDAERARALAASLEAQHRLVDALDALVMANRLARDPEVERHIVRLRRAAYAGLDLSLAPATWPHFAFPTGAEHPTGPLEIHARELDAHTLMRGVLQHGHLLVRGLVPESRVARLRELIDRALLARDTRVAGDVGPETAAWYDPLAGLPDGDTDRAVVEVLGGLFTADSPRVLFEVLETVRDLGVLALIEAYFGERPAMSAKKGTLRRIARPVEAAGWHQDGAFLGGGIRSINVWTALSRCGRDSPGIEIMPLRLDRMISQVGDGGPFTWTVREETIARELPGVPVWRPEFEAGDILFFDHWSLHRTAPFEAMPAHPRYAIESWFFAPSAYARDAGELLVV